jgi:DNA-binding transcriptional regulator YdaS (Cro superfamily)
MRDDGLCKALESVGGFTALARLIGVTPQSVFGWQRVPAERLADVSRVTGVSAAELRPDLAALFSGEQK